MNDNEYLFELAKGYKLYESGNYDASISVLHKLIGTSLNTGENRNLADAYFLKGNSLRAKDHLQDAIAEFQTAKRLNPETQNIDEHLATTNADLKKRTEYYKGIKKIFGLKVVKYLGAGWEGAVYLCKTTTRDRLVVKKFHPHRIKTINNGIKFYAEPLEAARGDMAKLSKVLTEKKSDVFYPFKLLSPNEQTEGLFYEYEKLHYTHKKRACLTSFQPAILYSFFTAQMYLLKNTQLIMSDIKVSQFMVNRHGCFKYIDYGETIIPTNDFRTQKEYWHIVGLIQFLYQIFTPEKECKFNGVNFDIILHPEAGLLSAKEKFPSLSPIFEAIEKKDLSSFLDWSLYDRCRAGLDQRLSSKDIRRVKIYKQITRCRAFTNKVKKSAL